MPCPVFTIESHRDLLKRAEAAEQRCQTLEAELLLEKEHAEQHADALQEAVQRAQAAEVDFVAHMLHACQSMTR